MRPEPTHRPSHLLRAAATRRGVTGRIGRSAPAGLLDAAASSLAAFVTGLVAVRYLEPDVLGVYAVGFSAFLLGSAVPAMLVYTPAEVRSVARLDGRDRLAVLGRSLPLGLAVALCSGAAVAAATLAVPTRVSLEARLAVALSLLALVAVSSGRDHVRRVLHQAGASWTAATVSALHLVLVVLAVGAAFLLDVVARPWLPFGILAMANLLSLGGALIWVARLDPAGAERIGRLSLRTSLREGGALLLAALSTFGSGFAVFSIVAATAGAAAAGQVEGARLLSQPATVVIIGVLGVLTPEVMTAATRGRGRAALRLLLVFLLGVAVLIPLYQAVAVVRWPGNPLPDLVPPAYQVDNLLAVMIVAQVIQYAALAWGSVPLALGRRRQILAVEATSAVVAIVVVLLLVSRGPWAAAFALLAAACVTLSGHTYVAVRLLRQPGGPLVDGGARVAR